MYRCILVTHKLQNYDCAFLKNNSIFITTTCIGLVHRVLDVLKVGICVERIQERQHSLKHHFVLLLEYRTQNNTQLVSSVQYHLAEIPCQRKFLPNQKHIPRSFFIFYFFSYHCQDSTHQPMVFITNRGFYTTWMNFTEGS